MEMREALREYLAPFPDSLNLGMLTDGKATSHGIKQIKLLVTINKCAVCMFNEEGHSLGRTIQSLALQQEDWIKSQASHLPKTELRGTKMQYMHAWIIADGWRRYPVDEKLKKKRVTQVVTSAMSPETLTTNENLPGNSSSDSQSAGSGDITVDIASPSGDLAENTRLLVAEPTVPTHAAPPTSSQVTPAPIAQPLRILSKSAVAILSNLFQNEEDELLEERLEKAFDIDGSEYVLLQYVEDGELAPVLVPCYDCIHSVSRQHANVHEGADDQEEEVSFPLFLSVLIKRRNAKKHDSHALFYEAICKEYTRHALYQSSITYFFVRGGWYREWNFVFRHAWFCRVQTLARYTRLTCCQN
jgi:hypothetical protein